MGRLDNALLSLNIVVKSGEGEKRFTTVLSFLISEPQTLTLYFGINASFTKVEV